MISDYNDYLTPYGAAYELDVSLTTVYNLLRSKNCPVLKWARFGVFRGTLWKN